MTNTIHKLPSHQVFGITWEAPLWSIHLLGTHGFFRAEYFVAFKEVVHVIDAEWQGDDEMPSYIEQEK